MPEPAEGKLVALSSDEAERLLLGNLRDAGDNPRDALWQLARFYSEAKRHEQAIDCLRRVMNLQPDLEHKAGCVLAMGQTMEQIGDYESAVRYYREAFALEPVNTRTWYFINNNLGFALNTLGHFEDGERCCRVAISIDCRRPNAFKNLGIALQGLNRFEEAARCFIQATQADASDSRSLKLLEELLARRPELNFATELECCRQAVHLAGARRQSMQPVVHRGWRKHLILAGHRMVSWFKRRRMKAGV
jgi:tetratricopeptide (TPR) repeat protein